MTSPIGGKSAKKRDKARYDQSTSGQFYSTPSAKRKAASRAKGMLPTDAGKFADVIDHIIANATPNKKAALREKGLHSPAAKRRKLDFHTKMSTTLLVKESHHWNEAHRKVCRAVTASLHTLKKHRMLHEISRTTGITWKYLMRYTNTKDEEEEFSRKKRSDTISQETVHAISRHYSDHEVTTPLPNHKLAQGECEGKLLNKPLNECYDDFTQKNPDIKVSRSTYCKSRPQNVVSYRNRPFLQCLCEYCVNVENAMNVINQTCINFNLSDLKISTSKTSGIQFEKVIEFSDGCPAQFKSRGPFADISYATVDLGVMLERHFFGSRHGKNDSDWASGVIKYSVRRAVLAGHCVITNAEDLYDYCNKKLLKLAVDTEGKCQHVRISSFHISNINRVRPERCTSATIKGTRSFHSVKTAAPGAVLSQNLSCLCEGCQDGTPCSQQHHVEQWVPCVFHTRLTRVSI